MFDFLMSLGSLLDDDPNLHGTNLEKKKNLKYR